MKSHLILCLLSYLIQSARSDFSHGLGNDIASAHTQKSAAQDRSRSADSSSFHDLGGDKVADAVRKQIDNSMTGLGVKLVSNEQNNFLAPNSHVWDTEKVDKNAEHTSDKKVLLTKKQIYDENDMPRSLEDLKKKRLQKKYQVLKKIQTEKTIDALNKKENKRFTSEQNNIKQILTENNLFNNENNRQNKKIDQQFVKAENIEQTNKKLDGNQVETVVGKPKFSQKGWNEFFDPPSTQPTLLKNDDFDESENIIDDYDHDREMKKLKKEMWLENLIPKSNKFLYNNNRYRDHMKHLEDSEKYKNWKDSHTNHSRSKRSVLSSIYVEMPNSDDEDSESGAESLLNNEESRYKKSKGSTTVCLEIKSDPTKPPSTICGPEIKPSLPFDYHTYSFANQNTAPNNFFYPEPQVDKTIWSMNPLHDPTYYSPNIYKHQAANRGDQRQYNHNVNGDRSGLKSTTQDMPFDRRFSSPSDKNYQSKGNYMTQNAVFLDDKPKPLKTTPVTSDYLHKDTYGTLENGQTPKSMLSENNNVKISDASGVIARNNFQDWDMNLDGEMSSNTYSYLDPEIGSFNQYNPQYSTSFGSDMINDFDSSSYSYPYNNFGVNDGIFKAAGQSNDGLDSGSQQEISNERPMHGAYNVDDGSKSADPLLSDEISNPENVDSKEQFNRELNPKASDSDLRNSYDYYPYNNNYYSGGSYPYRPNVYPYVPSRPYHYRPYQNYYDYDQYDPYCRSGRCKSAGVNNDEVSRGVLQVSPINAIPVLPFRSLENDNSNGENVFMESPVPAQFQSRSEDTLKSTSFGSDVPQFRGDSYYSGRPYPYRPSYEYQGSHSYPYSSRPYPYRPSGYSYPYNANCRTADGRSCRDAEDEGRLDGSASQIVLVKEFVRPNVPLNQIYEPKLVENNQFNGNYRSNNFEMNPVEDPLQFQSRSTMNSANLQGSVSPLMVNEIVGNSPLLLRSTSSGPVNSENLPEGVSSYWANEVMDNPPSLLGDPRPIFRTSHVTSVPVASHVTPALVPAGVACNVVHAPLLVPQPVIPPVALSGIGGHSHLHHLRGGVSTGIGGHSHVSGIGTHTIPLNTGHSGLGTHGYISGVGSHGIGGSHGLAHHHLLRESSPQGKEVEYAEEELKEDPMMKDTKEVGKARNSDTKTVVKAQAKLGAEELKRRIEENLRAAEEKLQSGKAAILEKINRNISKEKKVNDPEDKKNTEVSESEGTLEEPESRETFNSPAVLQLPSGSRVTYNSGLANIPIMMGIATPTASGLHFRTPLGGSINYEPAYSGYGPSGFPSPCSGNSNSPCGMNNRSPYNFQRSMPMSPYNRNAYMSSNTPIMGGPPPVISPVFFENPPSGSFESDLKSANTPCARNRAHEIVDSPMDTKLQLSQQKLLPAAMSYQFSPMGVSFSAPVVGSFQYQNEENSFAHTRPSMFASLAELKARDREMKQHHGYDSFSQNGYDIGNNELYYKANEDQNSNADPPAKPRNSENNVDIKMSALKKPELKPSKILTDKLLIAPAPILKLPKTTAKSTSLKSVQNEPCK